MIVNERLDVFPTPNGATTKLGKADSLYVVCYAAYSRCLVRSSDECHEHDIMQI